MDKQKISLVAAIGTNLVIGKNNNLPWRLPDDLKFFKKYTSGKVIIMGRKTWESLGGKPLPNRTNVILTKQVGYSASADMVFQSLQLALRHFSNCKEVCIVGGENVFKEALPLATDLVLTEVDYNGAGDAYFPAWNHQKWKKVSEQLHPKDEKHKYKFTFCSYTRQ